MPVNVRVNLHIPRVRRRIHSRLQANMITAERYIREEWKQRTSTPYPPASKPGQYPALRTGALSRSLRSNINVTNSGIRLSIRNTAVSPKGFAYPAYLEDVKERKGLRDLVAEVYNRVLQIMARG